MHLFYSDSIKEGNAILSPEESQHCIRVLRLRQGDSVNLMNGCGYLYEAVIISADPKKCQLEITSTQKKPLSRKSAIHIAIAPTKNMDRFEWFLEKAVEIGVDFVTPLLCNRSERKIFKTDRLHKLIISTMKQALVYHAPVLHELTGFSDFLKVLPDNGNLLIAHCEGTDRIPLKEALVQGLNTTILIGPEGDFTPDEVERAMNGGFKPISLGNNRLRTETAGLVACLTANLLQ